MKKYKLCRLCGAKKLKDDVLCLDDVQIKHEIMKSKILHCLQIQITENDKLPQTVCTSCADKVEDFYNFYLNAQKLQILAFTLYSTQNMDYENFTSESESIKSLQLVDHKLNKPSSNDEEWRHYQWKCSDCPGVFEAMDDLRSHYHNYHQKPAIYTCSNCCKAFKMFRNLQKHMKVCNYKKKSNKKVRNGIVETIEIKNNENVENLFNSDTDDKLSNSSKIESKLRRYKNILNKIYVCNVCNKKYTTKYNYDMHLKHHTKEKLTYGCKLCDQKFDKEYMLQKHHQKHFSKTQFTCNKCHHVFSYLTNFNKHLQDEHGVNISWNGGKFHLE